MEKMVTLSKIYTRTGDDGTTGLIGGTRVKKNDPRVYAYGDIDELNSHIGLCATLATEFSLPPLSEKLLIIQNELFDIGSELACPQSFAHPSIPKTEDSQVERLERWIDELNTPLPQLPSFVLPGGTTLNSHLHIARTVARRAERSILDLHDHEAVSPEIRHYVNRLSDLLFVMSRSACHAAGAPEKLWTPGTTRRD
jgi:cob(I)alamin adenosyltransferase